MRGSNGWGGLVSKGNGGAPGLLSSITGSQKKHFDVNLFCGITPFRARPT
jgi:hypothetical protein